MAQNYAPLIFLVPWVILVGIAISMIAQGWMIMNAHHGYTKSPKVKHPEMNDVKAGDPLLVIKFTDEDLEELQKKVLQQKIDELFEEPSCYEDDDDDDNFVSLGR
jgi:1-acyl-sn-glycerol-3-phosphate acyltransferase